jgi:hypothetical protein
VVVCDEGDSFSAFHDGCFCGHFLRPAIGIYVLSERDFNDFLNSYLRILELTSYRVVDVSVYPRL